MKAYTDLEQSKKLAEILPFGADMCYQYQKDRWIGEPAYKEYPQFEIAMDKRDIPCWSLSALLDVLPSGKALIHDKGNLGYKCICNNMYTYFHDNSVDACYEMILKLHELKML